MPYREIASRNSFGLKARQEEKPKPTPVVSPHQNIRLAGITTILGRKVAFLVITSTEPGRLPECLVFAEGQRQREIEVIEIDEKGGVVKVLNCGQEQTLEFTESGDARIPHGPGFPSGDINVSPSDPLSPEERTIVIEAQRLKAIQDGNPIAKILPPTDLTPEITAGH